MYEINDRLQRWDFICSENIKLKTSIYSILLNRKFVCVTLTCINLFQPSTILSLLSWLKSKNYFLKLPCSEASGDNLDSLNQMRSDMNLVQDWIVVMWGAEMVQGDHFAGSDCGRGSTILQLSICLRCGLRIRLLFSWSGYVLLVLESAAVEATSWDSSFQKAILREAKLLTMICTVDLEVPFTHSVFIS